MDNKLFVRNKTEWEKVCYRNYHSNRELNVQEVENAIILPNREIKNGEYAGGVCDSNFNFIAGFLRNGKYSKERPGYYGVGSCYYVDKKKLKVIDETVIFGGIIVGHFGHFILEGMSRLWWCINNINCNYKIVFTTILGKPSWIWDFFELLQINKERIVFLNEAKIFKKIIIPEESVHSWKEYTNEYLLPYREICKNAVKNSADIITSKKIYLTRTAFERKTGSNDCYNEIFFENFYSKKGYKVVSPEELSIKDQVRMMMEAEDVVTTLGSISHLILFCKQNINVTILTRVDNDTLLPQCLINQAVKANWCFVDVSLNFLYANRTYGVNQLGVTEYWKEYVKYKFNCSEEQEDTIQTSCYNYIRKWCEYYSKRENFCKIENLDISDFIYRMCLVLCNKKIDFKEYRTKPSKQELLHAINKLEDKIKEEENIKRQQEREIEHLKYINYLMTKRIKKWLIELTNENLTYIKLDDNMMYSTPLIKYSAHFRNKGWGNVITENNICGEINSGKTIEAVKIFIDGIDEKVYYSVYVNKTGWYKEVCTNEIAGTTGKALPISNFYVRLSTNLENIYDVLYRAYFLKKGWSEWSKNGEEIVNSDVSTIIEAIQIKLQFKVV